MAVQDSFSHKYHDEFSPRLRIAHRGAPLWLQTSCCLRFLCLLCVLLCQQVVCVAEPSCVFRFAYIGRVGLSHVLQCACFFVDDGRLWSLGFFHASLLHFTFLP